jgi:hypothetical protein
MFSEQSDDNAKMQHITVIVIIDVAAAIKK